MRLFEAFFWIEPYRQNPQSPFKSTRVLWHYPEDVSAITKEFRDIPQFCFPDLEKMRLEHAHLSKNEHFTFTLTDGNGDRVYGVCLRGLFRGEGRRFDVRRRSRHCLCLITRYPYFSLFKTILLQVHGLSLLEFHGGNGRKLLDVIYNYPELEKVKTISVAKGIVREMNFEFLLRLPITASAANQYRDVSILPLLEKLGIERFMLVLSAILGEGRLIFVADDVETLSAFVLGAAAMLHPFVWQHIFIPLLPSRLLSYAAAPFPYMIGVRRYLLPNLDTDALGDVIMVDADTGDCTTYGGAVIKDFVGDSTTALKQVNESLDRVKERALGVASKLWSGFNSGSLSTPASESLTRGGSSGGDIVAAIAGDLRAMLASKPGSASLSLQSVASGLRSLGLPSGAPKTTPEEAKVEWQIEGERALRDCLLQFFVYLFADMEEVVNLQAVGPTASSSSRTGGASSARSLGLEFNREDSRSAFYLPLFLQKHANAGDTRALQDFLSGFIHSQMFERFCAYRLKKMSDSRRSGSVGIATSAAGGPGGKTSDRDDKDDDPYDAVCSELRASSSSGNQSRTCYTVAAVRAAMLAVAAKNRADMLEAASPGISTSPSNSSGPENDAGVTSGGAVGSNFHPLAVQMTGGTLSSSSFVGTGVSSGVNKIHTGRDSPAFESNHNSGPALSAAMQIIVRESCVSLNFPKVMSTIAMRLQACLASNGRGVAGANGLRALILLRNLLLKGPEAIVTASLDFIPTLRLFLRLGQQNTTQQAIDFMALGSAVDLAPGARAILNLLCDQKKLRAQRLYSQLSKSNAIAHLTDNAANCILTKSKAALSACGCRVVDVARAKFPDFLSVHTAFAPYDKPRPQEGFLILTPPVASTEEDDGEDVTEETESPTQQQQERQQRGGTGSGASFVPTSAPKPRREVDLMNFDDAFFLPTSATASAGSTTSAASSGSGLAGFSASIASAFDIMAYDPFGPATTSTTTTNSNAQTKPLKPPRQPPQQQQIRLQQRSSGVELDPAVDPDAIFRVVNKDTGEVLDLRYDFPSPTKPSNIYKPPTARAAEMKATPHVYVQQQQQQQQTIAQSSSPHPASPSVVSPIASFFPTPTTSAFSTSQVASQASQSFAPTSTPAPSAHTYALSKTGGGGPSVVPTSSKYSDPFSVVAVSSGFADSWVGSGGQSPSSGAFANENTRSAGGVNPMLSGGAGSHTATADATSSFNSLPSFPNSQQTVASTRLSDPFAATTSTKSPFGFSSQAIGNNNNNNNNVNRNSGRSAVPGSDPFGDSFNVPQPKR